jgi:hypothetical protein
MVVLYHIIHGNPRDPQSFVEYYPSLRRPPYHIPADYVYCRTHHYDEYVPVAYLEHFKRIFSEYQRDSN